MKIRQDTRYRHDFNLESLKASGFVIIDFSKQSVINPEYRMIAYHPNDKLGRGSYGVVYRAYPLNHETGQVDLNHPLALKKFFRPSKDNEREAAIFNAQYGKCELLSDSEDTYMIMTCLPGKPLIKYVNSKKCFELNDELQELNFSRRIELICSILLAVMPIHHETPSTGAAVIHGDINGSNILFNINTNTKSFDVCLIDFGLSQFVRDSASDLQDAEMAGSFLFMANEIVEHELHSVKTDIYALTPIFALILGANNPFSSRQQIKWFEKDYFKIPYNFSGMLSNFSVPAFEFDISYAIKSYLDLMQHINPEQRPTSMHALKFFKIINNLCIAYEKSNHHEDVILNLAKLILLLKSQDILTLEALDSSQQAIQAIRITRPLMYKAIDLRKSTFFNNYKSILSAHHSNIKSLSPDFASNSNQNMSKKK